MVPLELGTGTGGQKTSDGATGLRSLTISAAIWTIHERDAQTDRWTDGHRPTARTVLMHSVER